MSMFLKFDGELHTDNTELHLKFKELFEGEFITFEGKYFRFNDSCSYGFYDRVCVRITTFCAVHDVAAECVFSCDEWDGDEHRFFGSEFQQKMMEYFYLKGKFEIAQSRFLDAAENVSAEDIAKWVLIGGKT